MIRIRPPQFLANPSRLTLKGFSGHYPYPEARRRQRSGTLREDREAVISVRQTTLYLLEVSLAARSMVA